MPGQSEPAARCHCEQTNTLRPALRDCHPRATASIPHRPCRTSQPGRDTLRRARTSGRTWGRTRCPASGHGLGQFERVKRRCEQTPPRRACQEMVDASPASLRNGGSNVPQGTGSGDRKRLPQGAAPPRDAAAASPPLRRVARAPRGPVQVGGADGPCPQRLTRQQRPHLQPVRAWPALRARWRRAPPAAPGGAGARSAGGDGGAGAGAGCAARPAPGEPRRQGQGVTGPSAQSSGRRPASPPAGRTERRGGRVALPEQAQVSEQTPVPEPHGPHA